MLPKLVLALLAAVVAIAVASDRGPSAQTPPESANPLEGMRFFVDREAPAWLQWQAYTRRGEKAKADLIWKIAREPKNLWVGRFTRPNFNFKVRGIFQRAHEDGAVPLLTVLRAQATACGPSYQGGGPAEDRRTMAWYDEFARAIGDDQVVIAFEPDSLGTIDCLARSRRDDRIRVLRHGVEALARLPNAVVYIEAGASDWESAQRTASQLRAVGIAKVRGFMLNATHYDWTRENILHGLEISRRTGGKHFVINTAENGRGPVHVRQSNGRRLTVWCNPGYRGLGPAPTTETSHPKVDAYLWINRPGYAQSCQGRPIGWYPERALSYARWATSWESPPPGTRFGHYRRLSRRALRIP
jgi:endoglucanase